MVVDIELVRIDPNPFQPATRVVFADDEIRELADDIGRNGVIQTPLGRVVDGSGAVVRMLDIGINGSYSAYFARHPDTRLQLAVGHRRIAALRLLAREQGEEWAEATVIIAALDDEDMARYCWAENAQRKDLTPLEEARSLEAMRERFGWSQKLLAKEVGLSRSAVANKLRLLKLPDDVLDALHDGKISERSAMALVKLYRLPESVAEQLAERDVSAWIGLDSDRVRREIDRDIWNATDVTVRGQVLGATFTVAGDIRHEQCSKCPDGVRVDNYVGNKLLRCNFKACYEAKRVQPKARALRMAVERLGVPERAEGEVTIHVDPDRIADGACDHMRLVMHDWGVWHVDTLKSVLGDEFPYVEHFVLHRLADASCERCRPQGDDEQAAAERELAHQAEQRAKTRRDRAVNEQLLTPTVRALTQRLRAADTDAWVKLLHVSTRVNVDGADDPVEAVAAGMLRLVRTGYLGKGTDDVARINGFRKLFGLDPVELDIDESEEE